MIQPRVLKGFRDSLPFQERVKKQLIHSLEQEFQRWGFVPIDTPVLEYTEVLLGKGGGETDKQIFRFQDNGGREVAMRYDLTVPFARFMAEHRAELALPFKRFHIAKVWRGENPQKGRYREFFQCDFDIVGVDSAFADFEILAMMRDSLAALGIQQFTIRIAHRGLFNAFLEHIGCLEHSVEVLRCVDKLRKIGTEAVVGQLEEITHSSESARLILTYITAGNAADARQTIGRLDELAGGNTVHAQRMRVIADLLEDAGILSSFVVDPSITRGLDYYTGIVYETFLDDLNEIGSVCSGGRYDDLASLYTNERLPGVGASIGLDRLLSALEELHSPLLHDAGSADVLILNQEGRFMRQASRLARQLRTAGIRCDVFLADKKPAAQYKYAEQNGIPYTATFSEQTIESGLCTLRETASRQDRVGLDADAVIAVVRGMESAC